MPGIAERRREGFPSRLGRADVLERGEHPVDRDPASAAEVDHLADDIRGRRLDGAFDCIRNVRELARLLAITENLDRLPVDHRRYELRKGHLGPLAWAAHRQAP